MRHQAVMGVVAVACVAVVSAPMLAARGGVHHRGGREAERHQYLAGVDFTADPVAFEEAAAAVLSKAFGESGALVLPKGPPPTSDDGTFSPFIGINPPSLGLGGFMRQPAPLEQGPPPPETPMPALAPAKSTGLIQAVGDDTPVPPVPPPEPPVVVPDDPPPPGVINVTLVTPEPPEPVVPPPEPPADPPPAAPVVLARALTAAPPAAIPEPGTWAMLVLGFGAIGAAIRRRRRERPVPEDFC